MKTVTELKCNACVQGRNSLNGERYAIAITGTIDEAPEGSSVYDVLRQLADQIEQEAKPMEYPDSLKVIIA